MKINGKTYADAPVGFNEASNALSHQEAPVTPKLLTRTPDTAKLMQAEKSGKIAVPLPAGDSPQISWVPFEDFSVSAASDCIHAGTPVNSWMQDAVSNRTSRNRLPTQPHLVPPCSGQKHETTITQAGQTVFFDEAPGDRRITAEHRKNVGVYFTDSWASRLPLHHQQQVEQGNYVLRHPNGEVSRCTSYAEFTRFTGEGAPPLLPELILHIAGPQLHNFLCQTYLYNQALSLFQLVGERRVEPMPVLTTTFELEHHTDGRILATYVASDDNLGKVMLVGRKPYDEHEAGPIGQAGIHFSGTLLFSPTLAFSIAPVKISATGMQFAAAAESAVLAVTDSFA